MRAKWKPLTYVLLSILKLTKAKQEWSVGWIWPMAGLSNLQPARQYCTAREVIYILIVLAVLMK